VIKKEKGFVPLDRSADCPAKLVIAKNRSLHAVQIVEPVVRGQFVVTEELPGVSVERISAGADNEINDGIATVASHVRAEVSLNLKLFHGIYVGRFYGGLNAAVLPDQIGAHAVHQHIGIRVTAAVDD